MLRGADLSIFTTLSVLSNTMFSTQWEANKCLLSEYIYYDVLKSANKYIVNTVSYLFLTIISWAYSFLIPFENLLIICVILYWSNLYTSSPCWLYFINGSVFNIFIDMWSFKFFPLSRIFLCWLIFEKSIIHPIVFPKARSNLSGKVQW